MPPGTGFSFELPQKHHALAYIISGSANFSSKKATGGDYVMWEQDGNHIEVLNSEDKPLDFLLLEGEPFDEPIVHRGPFVMNTQDEIIKANMDLYQGKFGYLSDE
jgi:redox-sensitive bicupin YhaK (pirin superfamily)